MVVFNAVAKSVCNPVNPLAITPCTICAVWSSVATLL